MSGLLHGMRVVEGSAFVAIPLAGMTLAQMGAEVIRVDRIGGGLDARRWPVTADGQSLFWAGMNKGKKSIAIDLTSARGQDLMAALVTAPGQDAGLYLTNLPIPGMAYGALVAQRPDLVMLTLTGDRHGGPQVDYTVNPAVGFPMATGAEGSDAPTAHVLPAWDCIAGNLAATALLAAERRRLKTGAGDHVKLALKDVAAAMLGHLGIIGEVAVNGVDRPKYGNALYGAYGQDFVCADGGRIMVIGLTGRQWRVLLKATETEAAIAALEARIGESLKPEGARFRHRAAITAVLAPWFAARSAAAAGAALDAAGATWGPFRSFAEALAEDPDLSPDNPMFGSVTQPGIGTWPVPASPLACAAAGRPDPAPAPALGQHSEQILADVLGLPAAAIGHLFDDGVVAAAGPAAG
jgi:2-methylfumaryl-CoA isomerase